MYSRGRESVLANNLARPAPKSVLAHADAVIQ
jgi:hypothetical protein